MGSIYRSEEMTLCQLFLQTDAAYSCVAELGELGLTQFRDLNESMNAFQRKFVNEIRRCDEMERKLRFIEDEIQKDNVPITECEDHVRAPQPKDMNDMEATFEKIEEELVSINANTKTLTDNHIKLSEMAAVIEKVKLLLDMGHHGRGREESINDAIGNVGNERLVIEDGMLEKRNYSELKFVAGVIKRSSVFSFEKLLWRMCSGKVYVRTLELDEETDVFEQSPELKTVFILFFSGEQLGLRVDKICRVFHARIYNCPDSFQERRQHHAAITTQLHDLHDVITRTLDHRARVITAAAQSLAVWKTKVLKLKMVFHTLNMFSIDVTQKCLIAECWIPSFALHDVRIALAKGTEVSGSLVHPVLNEMDIHETPPTYFRLNKFTKGFQNIVDAYGIANYREINPAPWTIISFPFLFAVMFGDSGHGMIMLAAAVLFVYFEEKLISMKIKDEIFNTFFGGRYIILLMGCFSVYTGFIYNDFYSRSINIFGSSWVNPYNQTTLENMWQQQLTSRSAVFLQFDPKDAYKRDWGPYPFGVDPVWNLAQNKLSFFNPMKMKTSVIIGIAQMTFGIVLSLMNYINRRSTVDVLFLFVPQILFLGCIFFYLCIQIIIKWIFFSVNSGEVLGQYYPGPNCAPNLLNGLINMFMFKSRHAGFVNDDGTVVDQCSLQLWYPHQDIVEIVLLVIAIISIPVMLFVKPLYLRYRHSHGLPLDQGHSHGDDGEEFNFGDVMVYQAIHTIEFALGCISHTASYLRLWALSLAHAQLSDVLWTMLLNKGLAMPGWFGAITTWVIFIAFAVLSVSILILMEGLSAFLHALRLHWVEFQSKFYGGTGIQFEPFSFQTILRAAEGLE